MLISWMLSYNWCLVLYRINQNWEFNSEIVVKKFFKKLNFWMRILIMDHSVFILTNTYITTKYASINIWQYFQIDINICYHVLSRYQLIMFTYSFWNIWAVHQMSWTTGEKHNLVLYKFYPVSDCFNKK